MKSHAPRGIAWAAVLLSACSSSAPLEQSPIGTAGGGQATAGGGGADGGSAGSSASRGGSTPSAGAGTSGGGAGGGAGSAGAAPISGAGSAGLAGATGEDPRRAAEVLDGFAVLKPCAAGFTPSMNPNNAGDCCCEEQPNSENQHLTKGFGGEPGRVYRVKLRVAGVAERYWYADGQPDSQSANFYVGGWPTIHSAEAPNNGLAPGQGACKVHPPETDGQFALPFTVPPEIRPKDGCYNGFNIFAMTVSSGDVVRVYYLNRTTDFDGNDRQPHSVYETDYTVTVDIPGQAQLDFYTVDGDHHQVTNNGTMEVPNVKTPQPFNGNFLELQVLEVTLQP